jgi:hypothetical protein
MSAFQHLDGMTALLSELYEINERVLTGDIHSAQAAIKSPKMPRLINHYHEALSEDGASDIYLEPYVAAGGWVGLTYSYTLPDGFTVQGSVTPRRV